MATMNVSGTPAGTITINKEDYEVRLSSSGAFNIYDGEDHIGQGESLDKAVASARRSLKRDEVNVEMDFLQPQGGGKFARRTIIGKHWGTWKLLVRSTSSGAQPDSIEMYVRGWRAVASQEDQDRYAELDSQIRSLKAEQNRINERNEIALAAQYEKLIEEATSEALGGAA